MDPACPPRRYRPELPGWLQELILRCLEPEPARRPAHARFIGQVLAHPESIHVSALGRMGRRPSWIRRLGTWWHMARYWRRATPRKQPVPAGAEWLFVLDLAGSGAALKGRMREELGRVLRHDPEAEVTCLSVLHGGTDGVLAAAAVRRQLLRLHRWAQPLGPLRRRLHFQVTAGPQAAAILGYARLHRFNHLVVGEGRGGRLRRYLGSVSARVVAEAPCNVTVVRASG